jgi:hypothetical protein
VILPRYPVPAIPAGSWVAAGNRFTKLVRPPSREMGAFSIPRQTPIGGNGIVQGIMSSGGASTVAIGPSGYGSRWYPNQVSIATQSGVNDSSTFVLYLNAIAPGAVLLTSYSGGGDSQGLAVPMMQPGDLLYGVWAGGVSGNWTQVVITGQATVLSNA